MNNKILHSAIAIILAGIMLVSQSHIYADEILSTEISAENENIIEDNPVAEEEVVKSPITDDEINPVNSEELPIQDIQTDKPSAEAANDADNQKLFEENQRLNTGEKSDDTDFANELPDQTSELQSEEKPLQTEDNLSDEQSFIANSEYEPVATDPHTDLFTSNSKGIEDEEELTEQTIMDYYGSALVKATGKLPRNAYLTVRTLWSTDRYEQIINKDLNSDINAQREFHVEKAYDINIYVADGTEYQPVDYDTSIKITIEDSSISDIDDLVVFRVEDNEKDITELTIKNQGSESVTVETDHFTIYTLGTFTNTDSTLTNTPETNSKIFDSEQVDKALVKNSTGDYEVSCPATIELTSDNSLDYSYNGTIDVSINSSDPNFHVRVNPDPVLKLTGKTTGTTVDFTPSLDLTDFTISMLGGITDEFGAFTHTSDLTIASNQITEPDAYEGTLVLTINGGHEHTPGTPVHENEIAATCTTDGSYDEVTYCTACHLETSRTPKTVPATGHSYNEGVCSICGDVLPELSVTANGYTGIYDGNAHGITVISAGNTIQYSTDNSTWSTTNPTYINPGNYTVYYKVTKEGYKTITGSADVQINTVITYNYNCPSGATNNGGSTAAQNKVAGTSLTLRNNGFKVPTRANDTSFTSGGTGYQYKKTYVYTFNGWNAKPDGTGTSYAAGASYGGNENMVLYAQWKLTTGKTAEQYYLTVKKGTGVSTATASQWVNKGSSVTVTATAASGYGISGGTGSTGAMNAAKTISVTAVQVYTVTFVASAVQKGSTYTANSSKWQPDGGKLGIKYVDASGKSQDLNMTTLRTSGSIQIKKGTSLTFYFTAPSSLSGSWRSTARMYLRVYNKNGDVVVGSEGSSGNIAVKANANWTGTYTPAGSISLMPAACKSSSTGYFAATYIMN